jgi:aspartyl protease family protein
VNEGDQAVQFIYLLGVLVLVASAFFVRRIPIGQGLKMLAAWVMIFAAAFIVFTLRDDFKALWNGEPVRFLIDSGATTTSVSQAVAQRAGVRISRGFPAMVQTANGIVAVQRGRADRLSVGTIQRTDLAVHVSEAFGDMNVIGMNFLSSLKSWSVEGRTLILKP